MIWSSKRLQLQALWKRIKRQWNTTILSVIAAQWQQMTRQQHSIIYQLVCTRTAVGHVGMEEYSSLHRPIQGTFDSNTRQRRRALGELQSDPKHAFMSRFGGPGSWRFVPYIFSPLHVKKPMLLTLESREIHLYLKHLNKEKRFRRKRVKTGTAAKSRHAAIGLATCPQRTGDTEEVLQ